MTQPRIYLANDRLGERSALRLLLQSLNMQVVGEAADWITTLAQVPTLELDILLLDWGVLPAEPRTALRQLRAACLVTIVIVLISSLEARQQAALSIGADVFISKNEPPDQIAERLRAAVKTVVE